MKKIIGSKELEGYLKLKSVYPDDYILFEFPVVALSENRNELLSKLEPKEKPYLDRLRLDLLVVDKETLKAKLAVEMQSSFHSSETQIFCDNLKKKILDIESIKLIRVWTERDWLEIVKKTEEFKPNEETVISDEEVEDRIKSVEHMISNMPIEPTKKETEVKKAINCIRELRLALSTLRKKHEDTDKEDLYLLKIHKINLMESDLFSIFTK